MTTSTQLKGSSPLADHRLAPQAAADLAHANAVMKEQLQYLADLACEHGMCDCPACQRYLRVRSALLEIFAEPSANAPRVLAGFARAA
jgi:hypothetical protein